MIQQESIVKVADNSGAKRALVDPCVIGGTRRCHASTFGDMVIVASAITPQWHREEVRMSRRLWWFASVKETRRKDL
jgi:large subunit ribosomal protein L14